MKSRHERVVHSSPVANIAVAYTVEQEHQESKVPTADQVLLERKSSLNLSSSPLKTTNTHHEFTTRREKLGIRNNSKVERSFILTRSNSQDCNFPTVKPSSKLRRPTTTDRNAAESSVTRRPRLNAQGQILPTHAATTSLSSTKSASAWHPPSKHKIGNSSININKNTAARPSSSKILGSTSNRVKMFLPSNKNQEGDGPGQSSRPRSRSNIQAIPLRTATIKHNSNNISNTNHNRGFPNVTTSPSTPASKFCSLPPKIAAMIRNQQASRQEQIMSKKIQASSNNFSAPKSRLLDQIKQNLQISPYNSHSAASTRPRSKQGQPDEHKTKLIAKNNNFKNHYNENLNSKKNIHMTSAATIPTAITKFQSDQLLTKRLIQQAEARSSMTLNTVDTYERRKNTGGNSSSKKDNTLGFKNSSKNSDERPRKGAISLPRLVGVCHNQINNVNCNDNGDKNVSNNQVKISKSSSSKKSTSPMENKRKDKVLKKLQIPSERAQKNTGEEKVNDAIINVEQKLSNSNSKSTKLELEQTLEGDKEDRKRNQAPEKKTPVHDDDNDHLNDATSKPSSNHSVNEEIIKLNEATNNPNNNDIIQKLKNKVGTPRNRKIMFSNANQDVTDEAFHLNLNSNENNFAAPNSNNNKDDLPYPIPKEMMSGQEAEFDNEYEEDSPINPRLNSPVSPTTSRSVSYQYNRGREEKSQEKVNVVSRLINNISRRAINNVSDEELVENDVYNYEDNGDNENDDDNGNGKCTESMHFPPFSNFHWGGNNSRNANNIPSDTVDNSNNNYVEKELCSAAHDFVADYLQLESLREVNHMAQVICRAKICNAVKGADPNLSLEQLILAKSRFLQLPCFADPKYFTKIKVPAHVFLRGKQIDKDLVTIQYLQTKMDHLHQKKLKNLEQKRTNSARSTHSSNKNNSNKCNNNSTFVVHQGKRKGVNFSSPESYVKSLERVLQSLQQPKWVKNCFRPVPHGTNNDDEDDEEEEDGDDDEDEVEEEEDDDEEDDSQDSISNASDNGQHDEKPNNAKSTTPKTGVCNAAERAALAKRILNMYTNGQLNKKLINQQRQRSHPNLDDESDNEEDDEDIDHDHSHDCDHGHGHRERNVNHKNDHDNEESET